MKNRIKSQNRKINLLEILAVSMVAYASLAIYPSGVTPEALKVIVLVLFCTINIFLYWDTKKYNIPFINAKSIVLLGIFAWVLFDAYITRFNTNKYSYEIIRKALGIIFLFIVTFYLSYEIRLPPFLKKFFSAVDYGYNFYRLNLLLLIFLFFLLGFLPILLLGGGIDNIIRILASAGRWNEPWARARYGDFGDYLKTASSLFLIAAVQTSWFYIRYIKKWSVVLIPAILSLWLIFKTGTRNFLAMTILPLFIIFYFEAWAKHNKKVIIGLILALYLLLSAMQLMRVVRGSPVNKTAGEVASRHYFSILSTNPADYHRDNQFENILWYIKFVPETMPHSGEWVALRPFYHFIPRAIWKEKPAGISAFFESGVGATATFAGSTIGDFYLCQGWVGVLICGLIMGVIARQFDYLIGMAMKSPAVLLIYSYGIAFLLGSIRSYQIIYEGWFVFVLIFYILKMAGQKDSKELSSRNGQA